MYIYIFYARCIYIYILYLGLCIAEYNAISTWDYFDHGGGGDDTI